MKNIPGTEYVHYHKDTGQYQILKKVNNTTKHFGCGNTLIIILMKRDWVIVNNWTTPYPKKTKTNEKYIQIIDNHYKVRKQINGKYRTYGSFKTLEEAIEYRDFIVSKGWSSNYKYKNPMRHICLRSNNKRCWHILKNIDGVTNSYGSFEKLEDAQKERDLLEKYDWDFDKLVEHDTGERAYLNGKISTRILFEKHNKRGDYY